MGLSPEERKKIYEEEKARIEAREQIEQERRKTTESTTSTGLTPNVAGLLCYVGAWITGIIFFILEQKNSWVRFHAAQSIVVFGSITVAGLVLGLIPIVGGALSTIVSVIGFIFWIILMVKAYNGERYKLGWAGDVAERMAAPSGTTGEYWRPQARPEQMANITSVADVDKQAPRKAEDRWVGKRGVRITASAFAIAWNVVSLIFFNFFHQYVAYYSSSTVGNVTTWARYPLFTSEIHSWLPILNTALIVSILGHIALIIYEKRLVQDIIHIVIDAFGLAAVTNLLSIFPFDFTVIPNTAAANATQVGVTVILVIVSIGIGIGILVRLIKLIVSLVSRGSA